MSDHLQTRRLISALGYLELANVAAVGKAASQDLVESAGPAAWLLDGASAHDNPHACSHHDASWFVQQLSNAIAVELRQSPDATLRHILAASIKQVSATHTQRCPQICAGHGPSATAVIVRRRDQIIDYLVLGDSSLLVQTTAGALHRHTDDRLASVAPRLRAAIHAALRDSRGFDDPEHHARLRDLHAAERASRNRDDGYWIAADDPRAADHSLTGQYNLNDPTTAAARIALVSDGITRAVTHLGCYDDWHQLVEHLFDSGITATISDIRHAELGDPDGAAHPRTSPSDDAAAIICTLAP